MKKYCLITTPIYYVNDTPHIGHTYCSIAADTLARFKRFLGENVIFSTGVDENSQKTVQAAEREGMDIKFFLDRMANIWKETWQKLGISFDIFIRTTSNEHKETVKKLLIKIYNQGDIYKKKYKGWYCVGCEKFVNESELEQGLCMYHKTKPEWIEEENYFFALSKYKDKLLKLFETKEFALPEARRNEMVEFIKKGLEDISISRASVKWGIPFPFDKTQVVYVWFDALINYITALNYYKDETKMKTYWKESIHFVGKDIFRFHTIMWPAMLLSAGLPPPKQVFGHGFFTINGEKISKSLGNVIDPVLLSEKYGIDTLRYYLLREIPFGKDSDFSFQHLQERYNSDLADDFGNLINRALVMLNKYTDCKIPEPKKEYHNKKLEKQIMKMIEHIEKLYNNFAFSTLLDEIWSCIRELNKYIDATKPWEKAKENKLDELNTILYDIFESLRLIAISIYPVMPHTANIIYKLLGFNKKLEKENFYKIKKWGRLKQGTIIKIVPPLFPKREKEKNNIMENNLIDISEFRKLKLQIAEIKEVTKVENVDKLYKLTVDLGVESRILVAGIAHQYKPEELVGKKIVVVTNLKPAKIRGIESNGMLLAATDNKNNISIITIDKAIENGSFVS